MPGTFVFRPLEANISHKDQLLTKINPYCSILLGDQKFNSKTSVNKGGQHPIWKDVIDIPATSESKLYLNVVDKDKTIADEVLGTATIDLKNIKASAPSQNWFPLLYKDQPAGEILLETSFEDAGWKKNWKEEPLRSSLQPGELGLGLFGERNFALSGSQELEKTHKRTFTEQREVVQPHVFTKNVETVEMISTQREIEVMEPRKVLREVEYTEVVPVKKVIETLEPTVVTKEVEVIESRVVSKTIQVVESFPVKKTVEVVEMRRLSKEIETFEPRTFKKTIEVTEHVPVKKLVTVDEPIFRTEPVEFVEPVITIQTITKEILEPMIISQRTTQEVGAATLTHSMQQSRMLKGEREVLGENQWLYNQNRQEEMYLGQKRPEEHFKDGFLVRGAKKILGEDLTASIQHKIGDIQREFPSLGETGSEKKAGSLKEDSGVKGESGQKRHKSKDKSYDNKTEQAKMPKNSSAGSAKLNV